MAEPGHPTVAVHENVPGCPPARGSVADLKATPAYGPMHLCRFGACEVWVADGGDHCCVLHSTDAYAVTMRAAWVASLKNARQARG